MISMLLIGVCIEMLKKMMPMQEQIVQWSLKSQFHKIQMVETLELLVSMAKTLKTAKLAMIDHAVQTTHQVLES